MSSQPRHRIPPLWLPNWREADEYAHIATTTEYKYETTDEVEYCDLETKVVRVFPKNLKPGTAWRRAGVKTVASETPKKAFAWEFLRRNPEYQDDYLRLVRLAEESGASRLYVSGTTLSITRRFACAPTQEDIPDDCEKEIDVELLASEQEDTPFRAFHAELYRTLTKWGLASQMPNPARGIHDAPRPEALWRTGNNTHPVTTVFYDNGEPIPLDGGIVLTTTEAFYLFDISQPLEPQFQEAKEYFKVMQRDKYGRNKQATKTSRDDYIRFLRLLDALSARADESDITREIYDADINEEKYQKNSQQFSHPIKDKLRNDIKAATHLMQESYRFIA